MAGFAFSTSPLDRLSGLRNQPEALENRHKKSVCKVIGIHGDRMSPPAAADDFATLVQEKNIVLLGEDPVGALWFARPVAESDSLVAIRTAMIEGLLSPPELSIAAQARSLIHWHDSHRFCAKCGTASRMEDMGYRRHCDACDADHFPRTDPVVIMAVVRGNETLLGRQKAWPEGMYSTLAGFMEPGETIEQAVQREVMEEVGLRIGRVDYVASQPWPFPASLMIGMLGEAEDGPLTIDETEIETARWFSAVELQQMLDRTHPDGLYASRPDAIAYHLATAALKRIRG